MHIQFFVNSTLDQVPKREHLEESRCQTVKAQEQTIIATTKSANNSTKENSGSDG